MIGIVVEQRKDGPCAVLKEHPLPSLGPHDLLVQVHAASVNRADLLLKKGLYPASEITPVLGFDFSGTVVATGDAVNNYHPGDPIMALTEAGAQAEYAAVHEDLAMPIPSGFSFEEAAAIPEVFLTAFQALRSLGHLGKGQTALIHSGASGVGTAAIQLAKSMGAKAFATAGTDGKVNACQSLGAEKAIDYRASPHFSSLLLEWTHGHGFDVILDTVGADFWKENVKSLAKGGKIISIAYLSGSRIADFDLSLLHQKWASLIATRLRDRSLSYKVNLTKEFFNFAMPLFAIGELRPIIHAILPWTEVEDAHALLANNETIGKVVLRIR